jgi:hypothetical protein
MWFKAGDHLGDHPSEGHELCQVCAKETRDPRLLETTNVRTARLPEGTMMTFVLADGPWWRERMKVHPNGWRGRTLPGSHAEGRTLMFWDG